MKFWFIFIFQFFYLLFFKAFENALGFEKKALYMRFAHYFEFFMEGNFMLPLLVKC